MNEFGKVQCTCAPGYTCRGMEDPNCCAHNCDYNELIDALNKVTAERDELARKLNDATSELEENEIKDGRLIKGLTESCESWKAKFEQAIAERDNALVQNAELVTMVESLRVALDSVVNYPFGVTYSHMLPAKAVLESTPTQCLRDIQSESGRAGFVAGLAYPDKVRFDGATRNPVFAADEYAEKIRRGEV